MKSFLTTYFLSLAVGITAITAFTVLVDPFAFFNVVRVQGFNRNLVDDRHNYIHNVKPLHIRFRRPDAIFVGSSLVLVGLKPEGAESCSFDSPYNYGLPGLGSREVNTILRQAAEITSVRHALVEASFRGYTTSRRGQSKVSAPIADMAWPYEALMNITYSYEAVRLSLKTLLYNLSGVRREPSAPIDRQDQLRRRAKGLERQARRNAGRPGPDLVGAYDSALRDLDQTLSAAKAKGVNVTLFIPPTHVAKLLSYEHLGSWRFFEDWKKAVAAVAVKNGVPIWDFADYHTVSGAEPILVVSQYFIDSSHFRPNVGKLMMDRICSATSSEAAADGFGTRIDGIDIEGHLEAIRARGADFWRRHPDAAKFYKDIRKKGQGEPRG